MRSQVAEMVHKALLSKLGSFAAEPFTYYKWILNPVVDCNPVLTDLGVSSAELSGAMSRRSLDCAVRIQVGRDFFLYVHL